MSTISDKLSSIYNVKGQLSCILSSYGYVVDQDFVKYPDQFNEIISAANNCTEIEIEITSDNFIAGIYDLRLTSEYNKPYVDWGDGSYGLVVKTYEAASGLQYYFHTYETSGNYTIKIFDSVSSIALQPTVQNSKTIDHMPRATRFKYGAKAYNSMTTVPEFMFKNMKIHDAKFLNYDILSSIGSNAFNNCSNLTEIDLTHIKYIGGSAFERTKLSEINIPNISSLQDYAFRGTQLKDVYASDSLTNIGHRTFLDCTVLSNMHADNISSIGMYAFCNSKINDENSWLSNLTSVPEGAFNSCPLKYINIQNAKSIGLNAFNRTTVISVYMPKCKTIAKQAFNNCGNLLSVDMSDYSDTDIPILQDVNAFSSANPKYKVIIPDILSTDWLTADNWQSIANNGHVSALWQMQ